MVLLLIVSFTITILLVLIFVIQQNRSERIGGKSSQSKIVKKSGKAPAQKAEHAVAKVQSSNGADLVATQLEKLPDTYAVFNNCRAGSQHIDHLVLSLNGIVLIKSSNHSGSVSNNDQTLCYDGLESENEDVKVVWNQAIELKRIIGEETGEEYYIKTIVCYPEAFVAVQAPIDGTAILNLDYLRPVIQSNRTFIPEKHLVLIKNALYI